jgi:cytidylate kinase
MLVLSPIITIDGPGGAGKGTLAHYLASKLNWHLLDSGKLYRLFALYVSDNNIDPNDTGVLLHFAKNLPVKFSDKKFYLADVDVTERVKTEKCGNMASKLSIIPEVRQGLLQFQRDFVKSPGLVADGRDMGTEVFKHADLKIFLDATPEKRATRRFGELASMGVDANLQELLKEINERDARDRNRAFSPLRPAYDAYVLDCSDMSIEDVCHWAMEKVALAKLI